MKTMKFVSMVMMITLISITAALAQGRFNDRGPQGPPPPPSEEQVDEMVKNLVSELTLTEEQAPQFEKAFKTHMEEVVSMREEQKKSRRERMEAFREGFEEELSGILNEAQLEKFKSIHPRRDGRRDGPRKGHQGKKSRCKQRSFQN